MSGDRRALKGLIALAVVLSLAAAASAATIDVLPGGSIQATIDQAAAGDVIRVAAGLFTEDLDFKGKAITVVGAGPETVVRGTGSGPVVRFLSGEGGASVLDSLTVTGGVADQGGGLLAVDSSPTVLRTVITDNAARGQGSGVYLVRSAARLSNNLIVYNHAADATQGDPHSVQLLDSPATLINNTIAFGDSNGLLVRGGGSGAVVINNIFAHNGSRVAGEVRGRGICDFSRAAVIQYNLFYRNRRAALLSGSGDDYRRVRRAEAAIGEARLSENRDGPPAFVHRRAGDFRLTRTSRARGAGSPDPIHANADDTRNDAGFTGGPLAPAWSARALRAARPGAGR